MKRGQSPVRSATLEPTRALVLQLARIAREASTLSLKGAIRVRRAHPGLILCWPLLLASCARQGPSVWRVPTNAVIAPLDFSAQAMAQVHARLARQGESRKPLDPTPVRPVRRVSIKARRVRTCAANAKLESMPQVQGRLGVSIAPRGLLQMKRGQSPVRSATLGPTRAL